MSAASEEYDRLRGRARELGKKGLDIDQVCERINGICVYCDHPQRDTVRHWMKYDRKPRNHGGGRPKKPVIASDGRVFESVAQAAEELGASRSAAVRALKSGRECRGLVIRYKED